MHVTRFMNVNLPPRMRKLILLFFIFIFLINAASATMDTSSYLGSNLLAVGESWDMGDGWVLTAQSIDASARSVWLVLSRDGSKVDDIIVKEGQVYSWNNIFSTKISGVYAGATSDTVSLTDTYLNKEKPTYTPAYSDYVSLTITQGEETSTSLTFTAPHGGLYAWADASGEAASWITPEHIDFGLLGTGDEGLEYYTISVPEYTYPGYYELIWTFGCKYASGITCAPTNDVVVQITVTEARTRPTLVKPPLVFVEKEKSDSNFIIGLFVILIVIFGIIFAAKYAAKRKLSTSIIKPSPLRPVPTPARPTPTAHQAIKKPEPEEAVGKPTASVKLHGEKTDVLLGEDIILKLSAVNLITKPVMTVQVILIPPSGMSVTSSEFATSGAGQYTTTYEIEPGVGRDIEVRIKTNQSGDFYVEGRIVYYFGEDMETAEDHTLTLPIKVRPEQEVKKVLIAKPLKEEKEPISEEEKRKPQPKLPTEKLDPKTRRYLSLGVDTALSMLEAEIAKAESDALQMQEEINETEEVLGKLASRLANKEIAMQTYNDLKNKYTRKVSELKIKAAGLENEAAKLGKIRSFIEEKGEYYT